MHKDELKKISKRLSYHLRHQPEELGITLDSAGWVPVNTLLEALQKKGFQLQFKQLQEVVEQNDKKRFEFSPEGTQIRASQGHSVEVDLEYEEKEPPEVLYHGTAQHNKTVILQTGLKKMQRHHVHLSANLETASKVGTRHGKLLLLQVHSKQMHQDGHKFYCSTNHVWLTEEVPPKYLSER